MTRASIRFEHTFSSSLVRPPNGISLGYFINRFLYACDRFLGRYVALPSLIGTVMDWNFFAAQILWVYNTRHAVVIKETMLTSRDDSGLDGIPPRRRAQFTCCVRPCARGIESRFRHCPRYCRHRVMGPWIGHRDRDRCAKGALSCLVSRATMAVKTHVCPSSCITS